MKIEYFPIQLELLVNRSNEYNKILTNKMSFITVLNINYWQPMLVMDARIATENKKM